MNNVRLSFLLFVFSIDFSTSESSLLYFSFTLLNLRQLYNIQRIVIFIELASPKKHLWYLLDGDVREGTAALLLEGGATYQQRLSLLHLLRYGSQALHGHKLRGGVDVVALVRISLLPIVLRRWLVGKALLLCHCCCQHISFVLLVDYKVAKLILLQKARS